MDRTGSAARAQLALKATAPVAAEVQVEEQGLCRSPGSCATPRRSGEINLVPSEESNVDGRGPGLCMDGAAAAVSTDNSAPASPVTPLIADKAQYAHVDCAPGCVPASTSPLAFCLGPANQTTSAGHFASSLDQPASVLAPNFHGQLPKTAQPLPICRRAEDGGAIHASGMRAGCHSVQSNVLSTALIRSPGEVCRGTLDPGSPMSCSAERST